MDEDKVTPEQLDPWIDELIARISTEERKADTAVDTACAEL